MKKQFKRWYEQEEYLRAFVNLMSGLSPMAQAELAVDMIIRASEITQNDYSDMISEIASYNPKNYKRWYDKNPNIHLAIESLKDMEDSDREKFISEFQDKILRYMHNDTESFDE